jgi:uncharacterized membrane protein YeiB
MNFIQKVSFFVLFSFLAGHGLLVWYNRRATEVLLAQQ